MILPETKQALDTGDRAAQVVVDHMKIMNVSTHEWTIPDGDGVWVVTVEYKGKEKP